MSDHQIYEHHEHAAHHHEHAAKHHREAANIIRPAITKRQRTIQRSHMGIRLHATEHHEHASKKQPSITDKKLAASGGELPEAALFGVFA